MVSSWSVRLDDESTDRSWSVRLDIEYIDRSLGAKATLLIATLLGCRTTVSLRTKFISSVSSILVFTTSLASAPLDDLPVFETKCVVGT